MVQQITLNYAAIFIAALAHMILGALWYSPILFGKSWMKLMNFNAKTMEESKKRGMAKLYMIMFIVALLMSYILAHFVKYTSSMTAIEGLQLGFWLWLGFVATIMINSVLWESKPIKLYLINIGYYFISLLLMGVILASWQ